jgi:hypothetical protein
MDLEDDLMITEAGMALNVYANITFFAKQQQGEMGYK